MDNISEGASSLLSTGLEAHDGHDSHHQHKPTYYRGSHAERAIKLYQDVIVYPARVRVFSHAQAVAEAMERLEAGT
jgi:hypothetical protein